MTTSCSVCGTGSLENALQCSPVVVQFQAIHQQAHLLAMSRIADGLVIHRRDAALIGLGKRSEAAGGIERLVQRAVDFDLLEPFERQHIDFLAIDNAVTQVAVFVDDAIGGPGQ